MDRDLEMYYRYITTAIDRILACLNGLAAEDLNWRPISEVTNSVYVLAIHTMGNAEQGLLATICGHPDYRDRDAEFAAIGESADEAVEQWNSLRARIQSAFGSISIDDLDRRFDHPRRGPMTGWEIMLVVATHANEHVGHAELTLQLLKEQKN